MKTTGKIAVLAMAMSLAFALSACGGTAASSSGSASASSASAASSSASASASSTSAASSSASAASASASTSSSVTASNATSYTNEFFGLDFVPPEGWSFVDAATLKEMNTPISSMAGSDAVEMVAVSPDQSAVIIVALIEPSSETSGMTAKSFLDAQTERMQKSLEGTYTYTTNEADVTFDGLARTLPANFTTITQNGKELVIGQAIAEKNSAFLDVLVTAATEADMQKAFEGFKATAE